MAVSDSGDFYVGGSIIKVGGLSGVGVNNIARWDGQQWWSLGSGVNGQVMVIVPRGPDVYVGGTFTIAGGSAITNLARWDGTNWWPVEGGVLGTAVKTLAFSGSDLYVGGAFTNAGGVPVNNIAKWDGQGWSDLAGGVTGSGSPLVNVSASANDLMVSGSDLIVAGSFRSAGGIIVSNVARWSGTSWSSFGSGLRGPAYAEAQLSGGPLYVSGGDSPGGPPYIAQWNGTTWTYLPGPDPGLNGPISTLFFFRGALYSSGLFSTNGASTFWGLARWDGTKWDQVEAPFYPFLRRHVEWNGTLFCAGPLNDIMSSAMHGVAQYDGNEWTMFGAGLHTGFSSAIDFRCLAMCQ